MQHLLKIVLCSIFALSVSIAFGQNPVSVAADSAKIYKIELHDGSVFVGNILHKDSSITAIKTSSIPKIEIPASQIKSIVEVDRSNYKNEVYWFPNPNA